MLAKPVHVHAQQGCRTMLVEGKGRASCLLSQTDLGAASCEMQDISSCCSFCLNQQHPETAQLENKFVKATWATSSIAQTTLWVPCECTHSLFWTCRDLCGQGQTGQRGAQRSAEQQHHLHRPFSSHFQGHWYVNCCIVTLNH